MVSTSSGNQRSENLCKVDQHVTQLKMRKLVRSDGSAETQNLGRGSSATSHAEVSSLMKIQLCRRERKLTYGLFSSFICPNADYLLHRRDENLSVTDLTGLRRF
jgi:hypothetical protein